MTRGTDQATTTTPASQKQMGGEETVSPIVQAPSAKPSGITADGASLQPTVPLSIKPNEASPPQTLPERGKQLSEGSGHDPSCLPSAAAVREHHQGAWPSWTLKAPGHEGTMCWYASARPRARDYRRQVRLGGWEIVPLAALSHSRAPWLSEPPARAYWGPLE
jgi:hypothetical protein